MSETSEVKESVDTSDFKSAKLNTENLKFSGRKPTTELGKISLTST